MGARISDPARWLPPNPPPAKAGCGAVTTPPEQSRSVPAHPGRLAPHLPAGAPRSLSARCGGETPSNRLSLRSVSVARCSVSRPIVVLGQAARRPQMQVGPSSMRADRTGQTMRRTPFAPIRMRRSPGEPLQWTCKADRRHEPSFRLVRTSRRRWLRPHTYSRSAQIMISGEAGPAMAPSALLRDESIRRR